MRTPVTTRRAPQTREDMVAALRRRHRAPAKRLELVGWLKKKGKTPEALRLADRLAACIPSLRCGSGACPVCAAKQQFKVAQAIARTAAKASRQVFALTVVEPEAAVEPGKLLERVHAYWVRRLKRRLLQLPARWIIGGADFSFNEHKTGRYEARWQPHLYALGETDDLRAVRAYLKERFSASDSVPRPHKADAWDGSRKALFYAFKVDFFRRVGVDGAERYDRKSGELRPCRNSSEQRLRSAEKLELLLHLEDIGLTRRVFTMHCQVHQHGRKYRVRLTP